MAKVSRSAVEAKELGLLRGQDKVVFHAHELLHVAKQQARALAESGYRPSLPARHVRVAGDVGLDTYRLLLGTMLEGRFISESDAEMANSIATVLCGAQAERGAVGHAEERGGEGK